MRFTIEELQLLEDGLEWAIDQTNNDAKNEKRGALLKRIRATLKRRGVEATK